jgi:hypothetical protein
VDCPIDYSAAGMILTSDKPWRRHLRTAWRWGVAAMALALLITAVRWCWYFGPSVVARSRAQPAKILGLQYAAGLEWLDFPTSFERVATPRFVPLSSTSAVTPGTDAMSDFYPAMPSTFEPERWRILAEVDPQLLTGIPTPPWVVHDALCGDSPFLQFHLDPPLTVHRRGHLDMKGVIMLASLADGQRAWVLELVRLVRPTDRHYNDVYRHRQILIFDEQLGKVLERSGWYEDLWNTTSRPTARAFLKTLGITLLVAAVPIVLTLRRASIIRRRFLARRCIACDYNFTGHADGLLRCPECGQMQWPIDGPARE